MILVNHHHLYYFWVVAKEGSVTKACEKLYLAQPTVSGQIIQLEKFLGRKLFERQKRKLILTEGGHLVLDYANTIFGVTQEMLDALKDRPAKRTLRIQLGIVDQVSKQVAEKLLKEIYLFHKNTVVTAHEGSLANMLGELDSCVVDLVLSNIDVPIEKADDYLKEEIGKSPIFFAAAPALARKVKRFHHDLAKIPLLLPSHTSPMGSEVRLFLSHHKVEPRVIAEIQDVELLRRLALGGIGAAPFSPFTVTQDVKEGKLQYLSKIRAVATKTIWLIAKKRQLFNPIAQHLFQNYRLVATN